MRSRKATYWGGVFVLGAVAVGCLLQGEPEQAPAPLPRGLASVLEAQSELPPESVSALQDLRLLAAVEMAYFTQRGGYATPQTLQADGYLDPQWPRVAPQAYAVSCELLAADEGFLCLANALHPDLDWFMVDATQVVRWARGSRPDSNSPVFGVSKEQQ